MTLTVDEVGAAIVDDVPTPGTGRTLQRWQHLAEVGRRDLCLAKLVEPHHDARAICADLGHPGPGAGSVWAVWAAEPPGVGVRADLEDDAWSLTGTKPFCSGAGLVTHALVTASHRDESRLFAVDLTAERAAGRAQPEPASWVGAGMARADTAAMTFTRAEAVAVGAPGAYVQRPGFWHGAIGVAACWLGGASGVAATLLATSRRRPLDPHASAHLGAVGAALDRGWAVLASAAREVDAAATGDPSGADRRRAESVRANVVWVAEEVPLRVARALGPAPLALDAEHAQRVADLDVFVRQHHAERDLAALGELVADGDESW